MDDKVVPRAVSQEISFPSHQSSPLDIDVLDIREDVLSILD